MRLIVNNLQTKCVIGGSDHLLDFDIIKKLRNYLRVRPEGYHRVPSFKKGHWDGWRYFITPTGTFATGFLELVGKYLVELGVELTIQDERKDLPELKEDINPYIGDIDGAEWIGRDFQVEAVTKLNNFITIKDQEFYFPRGIYDCATNTGKTSIVAMILLNLKEKYRTAFFVSNQDLYKQSVVFFSQVLGERVGEIKSGKYEPKWFTVIMVKTMYNRAKESINAKKYLNDLEVLIVDESDEAGANTYAKTLSRINAGMKIFVSGTPLESSAENNMTAIGLSGKVLYTVTNKFLIENGYSQKPLIKILLNQNTGVYLDYPSELKANIHLNQNRINQIIEILRLDLEKSTLITFTEMDHGYFMLEELKKAFPSLSIDIVHGTSENRARSLNKFKTKETKLLLASMIVKRGLNIPCIERLIPAQGGKSVTTLKQILGRGLRKKDHDEELLVYEFYDTGRWISKHSVGRIKTYIKEGLEVEYLFENKKGHPIAKNF